MGYALLGYPGINGRFFARYNAAEAGSWAARIAFLLGSNQEVETYRWLGMPPAMREWIGGRQERRIRDEVYQIRNRPYEFTLDLPIDDLRRDKTGQIMARLDDTGQKAGTFWEVLLTDLILANGLCYDGQNFFDTDHVSGDSGVQKNSLGATEVPASNVGTPTAPTAAELISVIMQTIQHMYTFKDDTGDPVNQNANAFTVLVPVPFMAAAIEALKNNIVAAGGGAIQTNVLQVAGFNINLLINPRLTWTDKLALFRTDGVFKPFIMQEELALQTSWLGEGSEEAFKNNRYLFGGKALRSVGYGMWQHAALVTLT